MARFRKKPVEVEAAQWFQPGDHPAVYACAAPYRRIGDSQLCEACHHRVVAHGLVDTLEGSRHRVCPGDWIITGVKGEHYPCKPDIFKVTYEPVQ